MDGDPHLPPILLWAGFLSIVHLSRRFVMSGDMMVVDAFTGSLVPPHFATLGSRPRF